MSISYQIFNQDKYLKVIANGKDDDQADVKNYTDAVISAIFEFDAKKVLCDERELQYNLSLTDTFQLGEYVSQYSGQLLKIAIVCNIKFFDDAKFYETVTTNRGMQIKIFTNIEEAESWLSN